MMKTSLLTAVAALTAVTAAAQWQPAGDKIRTEWAEQVSPENVLPEYPRPQMVRAEWQNLNGLWNYAIRPAGVRPDGYDGSILVPFAVSRAFRAWAGGWAPTTNCGTSVRSPCRPSGMEAACCCTSAPSTGRPTYG